MKIIKILTFIILCIIMLFVLFKTWIKINVEKEQIPVLMYHDVVLDKYYDNQADTISLSMFEKQLKYLKDNQYKTLTLEDFYCWKQGKCKLSSKSVLLTFDDGFYSFKYLVEPLLQKYEFNAVNFVIGETVLPITEPYKYNKYGTIGLDEINNHSKFVEYQSHSFSMHKYVNNNKKVFSMSSEDFQKDIDDMKKIYDFQYISYPYNTETSELIEILKKNNYRLAFAGENEKSVKKCNNYKIPRIGVNQNFNKFKLIFETNYYNNRYGTGFLRKIFVTIERKLKIRLG